MRIGQVDADTGERKQQLLYPSNNSDHAPVFDGVVKARQCFRQVRFDTRISTLNCKFDTERQKKLSFCVHYSDPCAVRSRIVDDLATGVERPTVVARQPRMPLWCSASQAAQPDPEQSSDFFASGHSDEASTTAPSQPTW